MNPDRPLALSALLLLAACSTPSGSGGLPPGNTRIANVVQVGDAASFGPPTDDDCRRSTEPLATQRYASVQYFSGRHAHLRIVPVADGFDVAEGDQVLLRTSGGKDVLSR